MAYLKHTLDNHEYEINTDLGDQISVRIIDTVTDRVIADYTKPMAEELVTLLESQFAHRSLLDIICISAKGNLNSAEESSPLFMTARSERGDFETQFCAN